MIQDRPEMRVTALHSPVWKDGLLSHRTQVILKQVPDMDPGCIILDQEHSRPCWGPLQAHHRAATSAAVPLHDWPLRRQLVQPDASIRTASLQSGYGNPFFSFFLN